MCGISGILHWGRQADARSRAQLQAVSQIHRGPDDDGLWADADVALSFRRLSIIDVEGGAQPMSDHQREIHVVFNGEIYNHLSLRQELQNLGHRFFTDHSDTEVFVHGWREWGEALFSRLNGMFAVAIWDSRKKALILARDRYGIKPLYISWAPHGVLVFASEARGILASGLIEKGVNPLSVREYLTFQNNWHGRTMFKGIDQLDAGTFWVCTEGSVRRTRYWDYSFPRRQSGNLRDHVDQHRGILEEVVGRQMQSDVPVTTYLSGGIDSSALTAAASKQRKDLKTYSCIFDLNGVGADRTSDEREFSREVAAKLGIKREELTVSSDSLITELDKTIAKLEYPRMGMSYANAMIARRVSSDAKVVLSGLGGDELHGGYVGRYQITNRHRISRARAVLQKIRHPRSKMTTDVYANYKLSLQSVIPESQHTLAFTGDFLRITRDFSAHDQLIGEFAKSPSKDPWDTVMYVDASTYMAGLLVLEDKLSMAHSLETRVPLLDNELVDFVSDLDWSLLFDGTTGKIIFRESVKPWVPPTIYEKPKMGFGPPDASWYRGTLKTWIQSRLTRERVETVGVLRPDFVDKVLSEHFSGSHNRVGLIWSLLSFDSWCLLNDFVREDVLA